MAIGLAGIAGVAFIQAVSSIACYKHDLFGALTALAFISIPMLPALLALFTKNPVRALGASLLFAPWLLFAFYVDCVRPYRGGGASMIYVAVLLYGLPSALAGAVLTGPVMNFFGFRVEDR